jgi:hypothetical protein
VLPIKVLLKNFAARLRARDYVVAATALITPV